MTLVPEWDWYDEPLPSNIELGENVQLYSGYVFGRYRSTRPCGARIGAHTGVYSWGLLELGPDAELRVGAYSSLVGCLINANSRVEIGDHALIANQVVIADTPAPVPPQAGPGSGRAPDTSIVIGDNCWIGQRAIVLAGARLGDGVIVGAATVVDFEVPAYSIVAGNPARVVGQAPPKRPALRDVLSGTC